MNRSVLLVVLATLPVSACTGQAPPEGAHAPAVIYHCPMHPQITSDQKGKCPICGMDLVPAGEAPAAPAVAGRAALSLTPERRQALGVRTEEVREGPLVRTLRTVGRLAGDERLVHHVHTKYEAYVEHLFVDFTGKLVNKGDPLVSLYSPDLVATQQEYLLAWRAQQALARTGSAEVARGGDDLLAAARERLLLWDIRPGDILRLEQTGQVRRTLDLYADLSGFVTQKTAFHGMRVTPQDTLFDITDFSHLWVFADVYESDLPMIREGLEADMTVTYLPGRAWHGRVTWISPVVEEKTRTIKVRVEVENADLALKPEMFADVVIRTTLGTGLVVPESAVLHAGERDLVFVERADGVLEPRDVQVGVRVENGFQALSGLAAGDKVVIAANFLLDSESSLRAALSALGVPSASPGAAPPAPHHH